MFWSYRRSVVAGFVAALPLLDWAAPPPRSVSRAELLAVMRACGGYALGATSNNARFQAEVVLRLVHAAERVDPERRPLLIDHGAWFDAFLERTGLTAASAPLAVRISNELGQDVIVDYRAEQVVEAVVKGPQPRTAANVWIFWPAGPGHPDKYSYDDTDAKPSLRVTQERVITYRLVDYGDRLWYAEIQGLHGRPTSGSLGVIFALIGEASVVESRSVTSRDGTQVLRGHARKLGFDKSETVTVLRNGRVFHGIPPARPDLNALALRLEEPLEIRFVPLEEPPAVQAGGSLSPS